MRALIAAILMSGCTKPLPPTFTLNLCGSTLFKNQDGVTFQTDHFTADAPFSDQGKGWGLVKAGRLTAKDGCVVNVEGI